MSNEICFTTDAVVRLEVKNEITESCRRLETQAFGKHRLFRLSFFMNILIDNLLTQFFFYFQNCKISLSKKIFHQHFVGFLPYFEQLLWEHFICHYIVLKIKK